jgi:hypothetical protein
MTQVPSAGASIEAICKAYYELGDPVAIRVRVRNAFLAGLGDRDGYEEHTVYARKALVRGGELCAISDSFVRYFPVGDVLDVRGCSAGDAARTISVGQRVRIEKYGNHYSGRVTEVARSRVRVRYTLASGAQREHWFNALDLIPAVGATRAAWERNTR